MCDEIYSKSVACEDIETNILLPTELPECNKSDNFENYEQAKQIALADLIDKMLIEIKEINLSLDSELEKMNTCAMEELKWIMDKLDPVEQGKSISIQKATNLLEQNKKKYAQLSTLLDEFDHDLKSLEKRRIDLIQEIVSSKLLQVNLVSTGEGKDRFDNVVLQLNISMLQKMQRSEDLKLKLETDGQAMLIRYQEMLKGQLWLTADKYAKHIWNSLQVKQNKRMALDAVFSITEDSHKTQETFQEITKNLLSNLTEFSAVIELPSNYDENEDLGKQWNDNLHKKLELLSTLSRNVEDLMKTAVSTLLEGFNEQIDLVKRTIRTTIDRQNPETGKQLITLTDEINELQANKAEELKHLQNIWDNMTIALDKKTEHTKCFITDVTSLWRNHLSRVDTFQTGLKEALASSKQQCEKQDKDKSIKLKSHIKSLREAKDLDKLNQLYITLEKSFDDISKLWIDNMQLSLQMINDIKEKEVGRLIEEKKREMFNLLQEKYPKSSMLTEKYSLNLSISWNEFEKLIDMYNTYMSAVDYRTLGLYEMLESYLLKCEQVIEEEINEYIEIIKTDTFNDYQNHVSTMQEVQSKTLQETKQIRYAELKVHSDRLNSHSRAVKIVLENINKEYNEVKLNQEKNLAYLNEKLKRTAQYQSLKTSWALKRAIYDLEMEWKNLSETLIDNITKAKSKSEDQFKTLQTSNGMFLKVPKHFNKGGNYSPEETKTLNKELKQLEKLFKSQQNSVIKNLNVLVKGITQFNLDDKLSEIRNQLVTQKMEESVIETLNIIRQRLKLEMKSVKSSEKALSLNVCELATLELDQPKLNIILENASFLCDKLRLPSSVLNLEYAKRVSTKSELSDSKKSHKINDHGIDYKLFMNTNEDFIVEENNFLSCTKGYILNQYNCLLKLIEQTTKITNKENENKLKTTLKKKKEPEKGSLTDESITKILILKSTLQNYNTECELFWLENVSNILNHVNYLQTITTSLLENKLDSEHLNYKNSLKRLEKSYFEKGQKRLEQEMIERNQIKKSLVLPLAHPTHHAKLKELHNKVKELAQNQKNILEKEFILYQDGLQNHHEKYAEKLKKLKENLSETQTSIHNREIFDILLKDLITVKENLPTVTNLESKSNTDGNKTTVESPKETTSVPENNFEIEKPKYSQSIWSDDECTEEQLNTMSLELDLPEKPVAVNINKKAINYLKQSTEEIKSLFDEANNNLKNNCRIIDEWVEQFECNMEQAKNIYTGICN